MILAIDPGPETSAWLRYNEPAKEIVESDCECRNDTLADFLMLEAAQDCPDALAIEWVEHYGMPVGKSVFETVAWIGRFEQAWGRYDTNRVTRREVKLHLCNSARAKDANIRQALIDKLGAPGTKAAPGPTYGIKSHLWAALAVAVTFAETRKEVVR